MPARATGYRQTPPNDRFCTRKSGFHDRNRPGHPVRSRAIGTLKGLLKPRFGSLRLLTENMDHLFFWMRSCEAEFTTVGEMGVGIRADSPQRLRPLPLQGRPQI